jgi:hypothetical protein
MLDTQPQAGDMQDLRSLPMADEEATIDVPALLDPVHRALGQGLSAFSTIESFLALIFVRLIEAKDRHAAMVAFDAINLTSPKIRVLRAVARLRFERDASKPDAAYNQFNQLMKRVEARADLRTKLAHWTVSIWSPDGMPITSTKSRIEARLVPPWFSGKNLSFSPEETVSLPEILDFTTKCGELVAQLELYNRVTLDRVLG